MLYSSITSRQDEQDRVGLDYPVASSSMGEGQTMTDQLVIEDPKLAQQIRQIARQEHRSVEQVVASMLAHYRPQSVIDESSDPEALARHVRLSAYAQARDYWNKVGNRERAEMIDEQLDEAFWLFDTDGIPRLKVDQDKVDLPASSLHRAGQVLGSAGFHSGRSDISTRSREIPDDKCFPGL
jgi:hypothetical protein